MNEWRLFRTLEALLDEILQYAMFAYQAMPWLFKSGDQIIHISADVAMLGQYWKNRR